MFQTEVGLEVGFKQRWVSNRGRFRGRFQTEVGFKQR